MNIRFPESAPPRDVHAIARFERIDTSLLAMAVSAGAAYRQYPALISRAALEQAGYPKAFPHLLMAAAPLLRPELTGSQQLEAGNLCSPNWCLSPAVCYHVYADLAGQTLEIPMTVTARGRCFRHEATIDPGRRQIEFEMREIVLLGSSQWVNDAASVWKDSLDCLMQQAEMAGAWQVAEDPFFLPAATGQALMQRLMETKLEYCSNGAEPIALASINRHGEFFGRRFEIRDCEGEFIHTACIAAGLDRWATCCNHIVKEVAECRL